MPDQPRTVQEYEDSLRKEWSQYVAVTPIEIDGVRAFNAGDPVPASHVTDKLVDEASVAKVSTAAGRAAAGVDTEKKG
jgi:hypothetical protein